MNLKIYKSNTTYKFNKSYAAYFVLFVLLFSFFIAPAKPARAAALSRPPTNLGLVGYWPMDEGVGTVAGDASGNGNNGAITGATWVNGKRGKALNFNGSTDEIIVGNSSNLQLTGGTISAWVKTSNAGAGYRGIVAKQNAYGMFMQDNEFGMFSWGAGGWRGSGYGPNDGQWHFLVCTFQSGVNNGTLCYADGVLKLTTTITIQDQNITLQIGEANAGQNFGGKIDDVRVYNRALSATEISKMYSSGQTTLKKVSESGLVGYWALNDGRGVYANDSSNNRYTGTLRNGPTWSSGKRGNGMTFDGLNDYFDIPSTESLKYRGADITISAWIKPNSGEADGAHFISKPWTGCGEYNYRLIYNSNKTVDLSIMGSVYDGLSSGGATAEKGSWSHVAATVDSSKNMKIYINGALVNSGVHTITSWVAPSCGDSNLPLSIGTLYPYGEGWGGATGHAFNGDMDEVRIYNRVLSATEIQSLYKQNETMANAPQNDKLTNGLVGLWSFNGKDVSGSTAYDRSGQGRNGTIVGSAPLTAGKVGQGISFNNSGQYVQSGSVFSEFGTSNQAYTIAGWMKINNGVSSGNVVFMGDSWCLPPVNITSGKLRATSWNNGQVDSLGTTTLSPNIWYQFATTWDASNGLRIFVNGELENSTVMANFTAAGSARVFRAGYSPGFCAGDTGALNGAVDEVRVYNRALSASEVKQLYLMGK